MPEYLKPPDHARPPDHPEPRRSPSTGRLHWAHLICQSYELQVGPNWWRPGQLDHATDVVLCHDCSTDPVFVYANRAAALLWERPVAAFIGWPSRLTAPAQERAGRAAALADAAVVVRGYSGVRVASSGRLFRIEGATVWPVHDRRGVLVGQAATFSQWVEL